MKFFVLTLLLMASLVSVVAALNTSYVSYSINVSARNYSSSLVFNESVSPTSNTSLLSLVLLSSSWKLEYTTSVNSTQVFPYVPSIQNKSVSYTSANYSLNFTLVKKGVTNIEFGGKAYMGTVYSFSGIFSSHEYKYSISGNISAFPSSLVYSFYLSLNQTIKLSGTLVSTNLPLDQDTQQPLTMAVVVAGVGVATTLALGVGLPLRKRRASTRKTPKSHWVD